MKLGYSFPREIEAARRDRVPLVIPAGTVEYHGPHCAYGCDTLIVEGLLDRLSGSQAPGHRPLHLVRAFQLRGGRSGEGLRSTWTTTASRATSYDILKALIDGGWRNIYVLIHHQYEEENLLPMTLCFKKAGMKIVFDHLEATMGRGWWGDNKNKDFYDNLEQNDSPWNWIKVLPAMSKEVQHATGYDHAGKYECLDPAGPVPGDRGPRPPGRGRLLVHPGRQGVLGGAGEPHGRAVPEGPGRRRSAEAGRRRGAVYNLIPEVKFVQEARGRGAGVLAPALPAALTPGTKG